LVQSHYRPQGEEGKSERPGKKGAGSNKGEHATAIVPIESRYSCQGERRGRLCKAKERPEEREMSTNLFESTTSLSKTKGKGRRPRRE